VARDQFPAPLPGRMAVGGRWSGGSARLRRAPHTGYIPFSPPGW